MGSLTKDGARKNTRGGFFYKVNDPSVRRTESIEVKHCESDEGE